MILKKFFYFSLAAIVSAFAASCSVPPPSESDKCPDYRISIMCYAYGPNDECGNPTCAPQDVEDSIFRVQDSIYYASIYEAIQESGKYTTKDSVAAYLCKFDKLPSNYVSKAEGQKLYESKTGKTFEKWNFNPWTTIGVMIGGDKFSNDKSMLPQGSYHEADVDYPANNRGTERLVYQSDCIIYYTSNHYETFSKLEIH
ncbi:MAG: hypothetical protein J6W51_04350 [Fibrobacter sp.]|nr:hypothetical protein [Fibrobacter sp.]